MFEILCEQMYESIYPLLTDENDGHIHFGKLENVSINVCVYSAAI